MTSAELAGLQGLGWLDLGQLALHFLSLSLLSVGGALAAAPGMHQYLVLTRGWLSDAQFAADVGLAQAAPGPNMLFVALLGLSVAGPLGMAATMLCLMTPSSLLAFFVGRYRRKWADSVVFRAITAGLTPLSLGLLLSTGWVLLGPAREEWRAVALVAATIFVMLRTKLSPLIPIGVGAAMGMLGLL